jgi:integrase
MAWPVEQSKDGYLLPLAANALDDRGDAIGKRFTRLKRYLGYGSQTVFHSIKKTAVAALENAGAPESVVAAIVGHAHTTLTFGLYSGGTSLQVKAAALAKLAYPS